jgi:2-polyprenyl-3-methyl-5-hydroxy-6-metoxy-1,4-benzoquinol methylase
MRRETTNKLRYVLEELVPPALRDSILFRKVAELAWSKHVNALSDFRRRAPFLTEEEYAALYQAHPRVHEDTDNSEACVHKIIGDVVGSSVCDIGCGTGYLLERIRERHVDTVTRLVGVDFLLTEIPKTCTQIPKVPTVEFLKAKVEALPFGNREFDTVTCTHVLEHILDYRKALMELRRIARRRLIIVVPREREARYTLNPHFQFFPYPESFLRATIPIPPRYECVDIARDIYYREDIEKPE